MLWFSLWLLLWLVNDYTIAPLIFRFYCILLFCTLLYIFTIVHIFSPVSQDTAAKGIGISLAISFLIVLLLLFKILLCLDPLHFRLVMITTSLAYCSLVA